MNRSARSHRSTKIPGVRIKPRAAVGPDGRASTSRRRLEDQDEEEEQEARAHFRQLRDGYLEEADKRDKRPRQYSARGENDEDNENEESTKPLLGCVLCMSGITGDKGMLSSYATAMGAKVEGNLTEDATHLIAPMPGSEKYRCAVQLGIPILRPGWVAEMREKWTNFEDFDFEELLEQHRLSPFEKLGVGLAGFTDRNERHDLRRRLQQGGAATPEVFTLDGKLTHLISATSKTADSKTLSILESYRRKAERFLRRGEPLPSLDEQGAREMHAAHQIRVISRDWLEDSLEVGVCLDTDLYDIFGPPRTVRHRDDFKRGICEARERSQAKLQRNRKAAKERAARHVEEAMGVRRTRKSEALAAPGQSSSSSSLAQGQMSNLLAPASAVAEHSPNDMKNTERSAMASTKSRLQNLSREKSFGQTNKESTPDAACSPANLCSSVNVDDTKKDVEVDALTIDPNSGLHRNSHLKSAEREKRWTASCFRVDLRDESRNKRLSTVLQANGVVKIVAHDDQSQDADFCVVPMSCLERHEQVGTKQRGTLVTHLFVERCMHEDRLVDPDAYFALRPCLVHFPLEGAASALVAVTGLSDGIEQCQALFALKEAGIQTCSTLKRSVHTHLLCGSDSEQSKSSQLKRQRAKEWGIPIVGLDFVARLFTEARIEPTASINASKLPGQDKSLKARSINSDRAASVAAVEALGETQTMEENLAEAKTLPAVRKTNEMPLIKEPASRAIETDQDDPQDPYKRVAPQSVNPLLNGQKTLAPVGGGQDVLDLSNGHMERQSRREQSLESRTPSTSSSSGHAERTKKSRGKHAPSSHARQRRAMANGIGEQQRDDAEALLAKQREAEKVRAALISQPQSLSLQDSSLRVVYEDPASRRAWNQMKEIIGGVGEANGGTKNGSGMSNGEN